MKDEDAKYCAGCVYASKNSGVWKSLTCDYILLTGKRRGCKAGVGCPHKTKGNRKIWLPVVVPSRDRLMNGGKENV